MIRASANAWNTMTKTDSTSPASPPVSAAAVLAILVGFALFMLLTYWAGHPRRTLPAYGAAEAVPADQAWQATAQGRRAYLLELQAKQQKQAASYGWVDRKTGIVQLPLERAMELVAREYGAKNQSADLRK